MTAPSADPKQWTVGLVGYGEVGRILAEDLRKQDVSVCAYDVKLRSDESGRPLREHARNMAVLRYGFQFRKTDLSEQTLRDSLDSVINRTRRKVESKNESLSAVIHGVDDAWEVCLLKFTIDLVERSSGNNLGDFRKRGLI